MVELKHIKIACSSCRLSELCLPRGLDQTEMRRLDDLVTRKRPLHRGDHLYRQGDRFNALYAARVGSLRGYTATADGVEQTVGFYLPGELIGLDGLEHDRHSCSVVALDTTAVCELPFANFTELCAQLPSLQRQMLRLVGKEITADHEILLTLGTRNAEERLATFLLSLSKRFGDRGLSATDFRLSMSRRDIADYLGIAVETISRQLSNFQKQGILDINHREVRILDMERLRCIIQTCPSVQPMERKA